MDFRHPSRSQQDRTRREDRHLNFYIARDMLLTIGMLLNTLTGRPARALAAYDGR
jgi:hypothetical protein